MNGDGSPSATLSIDEAEVRQRGRVAGSFGSLEVESVDGSSDILRRLASRLEATGLVTTEERSKEEIARQLVLEAGSRAKIAVPKNPGVRADDPFAEAGRKVLYLHLARMLAAEPGTRSGEDVEDLHKMRVATRRMRAVWRVFDGAYRPKLQRRYVKQLREVAAALGAVRDLDVQIDGLAGHRSRVAASVAAALEPMAEELARRRHAARADLLELLDSHEYQRFVDDYRAFVETPGLGAADATPGSPIRVRDHAAGRTWQAYERLRAHEVGLRWADVPALHALRIDAKRLRYTLESFAEVLPDGSGPAGRVGRHDAGPPRDAQRRAGGGRPDARLARRRCALAGRGDARCRRRIPGRSRAGSDAACVGPSRRSCDA